LKTFVGIYIAKLLHDILRDNSNANEVEHLLINFVITLLEYSKDQSLRDLVDTTIIAHFFIGFRKSIKQKEPILLNVFLFLHNFLIS